MHEHKLISLNLQTLRSWFAWVKERSGSLLKLLRLPSVGLLLAMAFLDAFAVQANSLLLQLASKRLRWSLGRAAYLLSIRAAVALFMTLGVLPAGTHLLHQRLHLPSFRVDLSILRISFVTTSVGFAGIATAWRPWTFVFGKSQPPNAFSLRDWDTDRWKGE